MGNVHLRFVLKIFVLTIQKLGYLIMEFLAGIWAFYMISWLLLFPIFIYGYFDQENWIYVHLFNVIMHYHVWAMNIDKFKHFAIEFYKEDKAKVGKKLKNDARWLWF